MFHVCEEHSIHSMLELCIFQDDLDSNEKKTFSIETYFETNSFIAG